MKTLFTKLFRVGLSMAMVLSFAVPYSMESSAGMVNTPLALEEIELIKGDLTNIPVNGLIRVSVTDPGVADIADATEEEVLLLAKSVGQTVMFVWESEEVKRTIVIRVIEEDLDLVALRVKHILDNANLGRGIRIKKSPYEGRIIVMGETPKEKLEQIRDILGSFEGRVVNLVREEEIEDLIQIDMQITELNTTLSKEMGLDWSTSTSASGLSLQYDETLPSFDGSVGDLFKVGDFARTSQMLTTIRALVSEGKAEVLSKPRLLVANGKEASFLVGGEIPIRSTTTSASGGSSQENIEFKEYGVNLILTPTIRKGKVDITLNVEISDIDESNKVGDDVAFVTRTAQTQLFLENKQTVVLAGLIKKSEAENVNRVPVVSKVPIIGALFRSKSTPERETEVVISLTPTIQKDAPVEKNERVEIIGAYDNPYMDKQKGSDSVQETISVITEETVTEHIVEADLKEGLVQPSYEEMPVISKSVAQDNSTVPAMMGPYVKEIQKKISEAISYPYEAQKNGYEGTVKLTMRILRNGSLDDLVLKETSGYAVFDQDALNTARILSPYPQFPEELNLEEIVVTIPIVYSLNSYLQNVVKRQ